MIIWGKIILNIFIVIDIFKVCVVLIMLVFKLSKDDWVVSIIKGNVYRVIIMVVFVSLYIGGVLKLSSWFILLLGLNVVYKVNVLI